MIYYRHSFILTPYLSGLGGVALAFASPWPFFILVDRLVTVKLHFLAISRLAYYIRQRIYKSYTKVTMV